MSFKMNKMFNSFIAAEPVKRSAAGLAAGHYDGGRVAGDAEERRKPFPATRPPRLVRHRHEPRLYPVNEPPHVDESKQELANMVWKEMNNNTIRVFFMNLTEMEFKRWFTEKLYPNIVNKFKDEDAALLTIAIAFDYGGPALSVKDVFFKWVRQNFAEVPASLNLMSLNDE